MSAVVEVVKTAVTFSRNMAAMRGSDRSWHLACRCCMLAVLCVEANLTGTWIFVALGISPSALETPVKNQKMSAGFSSKDCVSCHPITDFAPLCLRTSLIKFSITICGYTV